MKNSKKQFYFFVGTTAEYIKLAPIIKEFRKRKVDFKLITSGQNTVNYKELEDYTGKIKPDIALKQKIFKSSMVGFFIWTLRTLIEGALILRKEFRGLNNKEVYFFIHGDTISSLIGSLIAKLYGFKIVHIESGLRSFNFLEPFPEEIDRFIITRMANYLFCPNQRALKNVNHLKGEKVDTKENTLIEATHWALKKKNNYKKRFGKYYILIMHRQEHVYFQKDWTREMLDLVINNARKDLTCIFIMHALTSRFLQAENFNVDSEISKRLLFVPRLPYADFMQLMYNSEFIATDGCTNQEEAYYMGLPLLALRHRTERTEGMGQNVVISRGNKRIIKDFLANYKKYKRAVVRPKVSPSKIVVDYLLK